MGGVAELIWGRWLVVMDGNVSRYDGQPIMLRLLVFSCLAGPPSALALALYPMLRTLGTGCLMDVQQEAGTGRRWGGMGAGGEAFGPHACGFHSFLSELTVHGCCSLGCGEARYLHGGMQKVASTQALQLLW